MRLALIADIHGNLVALDAVLAEIAAEPVDTVVCLGDVAALGPQPRQVLARLREIGCPVVMGNADDELLAPPDAPAEPPINDSAPPADDSARIDAISRWGAAQLTPADRDYIATFQSTVELPLDSGSLLACHGSPRSFNDHITATTPADDLDQMLAGVSATIVAGGHTHIQLLHRHRALIVLNPGSVGLAYDRVPPETEIVNPAWAEYAVITAEGSRLDISLRRTPFDLPTLLQAASDSGMPHTDWWRDGWRV